MGRLIKFEFRKLFKSKYFYVLLSISLVLIVVSAAIQKLLPSVVTFATTGILAIETTTTPYAFAKSSLSISFSLISGIFICLNATEDFSHSTIKNVFSRGFSRKSVFLSKYLVSLIGCYIVAISNFVLAFGVGYGFFESKEIHEEYAFFIYLGQLLSVMAYHALFFFIAYSMRKTGPTIAICILISALVVLLFTLIESLVLRFALDTTRDAITNKNLLISNYWLDNIIANLTSQRTDDELLTPNLLTLTGYIVTFFSGGFLINLRKEV